jgi:Lar family restriction alleviation protein
MADLNQGASIEAERAAPCPFCGSENVKAHVYSAILAIDEPDAYCQCGDCSTTGPNGKDEASAIASWNRRTPADAVGAGELPPLPKHEGPIDTYHDNGTITSQDGYTAEQMQQFGREAIAHYLRKQAGQVGVKPWRERLEGSIGVQPAMHYADAEIADLRAQLAAKGQGNVKFDLTDYSQAVNYANGTSTVVIAPASAQPADPRLQAIADAEQVLADVAQRRVERAARIGAQPDQRESAAGKCMDWSALGYKVGATVEQDGGKSWASRAVITCVHPNGALDVVADGKTYGWSARFCKVVAAPAAQPKKDEQKGDA